MFEENVGYTTFRKRWCIYSTS